MKYFFKFKIFLLCLILLSAVCFLGSEKRVLAGAGENVSGWAWNSNVGWISFNTIDCDTNENSAYDVGDTGPAGCPAIGTPFFDYGVNIDLATGNFSGYAWNDNVGWISFNRMTCDSGIDEGKYCEQNIDCINNDCLSTGQGATGNPLPLVDDPGNGTGPIAKLVGGNILGWAKILSMNNDGWIRFDHGQVGFEAAADAAGELIGWAYNEGNNNVGIGWISLNCASVTDKYCEPAAPAGFAGNVCTAHSECGDATPPYDYHCDDVCSISGYSVHGVLNGLPTVTDMTAPNWSPAAACGTALRAYLTWTYNDTDDLASGNKMSAYRIIVKNETDNVEVLDTGKCIKQFDGDNSCCAAGDADCLDKPEDCKIDIVGIGFGHGDMPSYELNSTVLNYSKSYSWSAEVWDSDDGGSGLAPYNTAPDTPVSVDDGNPLTFTTFVSEFPNPDDFIWTPKSFSAEEDVLFESMDMAKYYTGNFENDCDDANCSWDWSDPDASGNIDINSSNASSTIIKFNSLVNNRVKLTLTDNNNGYSCASTSVFDIKYKLPSWIETK